MVLLTAAVLLLDMQDGLVLASQLVILGPGGYLVPAETCADSICACGEIRLATQRAYGFIAGRLCPGGSGGLIFPKAAGSGAAFAGCCAGTL